MCLFIRRDYAGFSQGCLFFFSGCLHGQLRVFRSSEDLVDAFQLVHTKQISIGASGCVTGRVSPSSSFIPLIVSSNGHCGYGCCSLYDSVAAEAYLPFYWCVHLSHHYISTWPRGRCIEWDLIYDL
ncbi:hypothetical protein BS47DRAFT_235655 [Hydnum rufescens UP504]|uniref:Uncharacterized protein n=1 Tax=Hydnum rufescens UP504 TaxID=1448309 RepID=A0A9P6AMA1_9AGAM|nr:hypothetical protein BS47DRAFT_235655 [Hydnum rufescens UP504]